MTLSSIAIHAMLGHSVAPYVAAFVLSVIFLFFRLSNPQKLSMQTLLIVYAVFGVLFGIVFAFKHGYEGVAFIRHVAIFLAVGIAQCLWVYRK